MAGFVNKPSNVKSEVKSSALTFDVLTPEAFVTALSAASGTDSVACVTAHANLAVEQASFCFRESCHASATNSPYLITTEPFNVGQCGLLADLGSNALHFEQCSKPSAARIGYACVAPPRDSSRFKRGGGDRRRRVLAHQCRDVMVPKPPSRTCQRGDWGRSTA